MASLAKSGDRKAMQFVESFTDAAEFADGLRRLNASLQAFWAHPECPPRARKARFVAVFDIDDTIVKSPSRQEDIETPIAPMVSVVRDLSKSGARVHFVTARPDTPSSRRWTTKMLREVCNLVEGEDYEALWLVPSNMRTQDLVGPAKEALRAKVCAECGGMPIAVTIGDQWWDLVAGEPVVNGLTAEALGVHEPKRYLLFRMPGAKPLASEKAIRLEPGFVGVGTQAVVWGVKIETDN